MLAGATVQEEEEEEEADAVRRRDLGLSRRPAASAADEVRDLTAVARRATLRVKELEQQAEKAAGERERLNALAARAARERAAAQLAQVSPEAAPKSPERRSSAKWPRGGLSA